MVSNKAIALVAFCALLWGLYWMPVHALAWYGVSGFWTGLAFAVAGFFASLPFLLRDGVHAFGWRHALGALGIGFAMTLYSAALAYTDIVRVVLLFYLAPMWSTLIECLFLGRRWTWRSALGIALSALGLLVIFRGELPVEGLGVLGDWMALAAGLCWSLGSATMFSASRLNIPQMVTASFIGALLVAFVGVLLLDDISRFSTFSSSYSGVNIVLFLCVLGLLYLVPVSAITLWGATQIPPAMMSFLLTLEVIAAVVTSALLLDQPFGAPEFIGTVLIISAAMVEFVQVKARPGSASASS